ncbi:sugar kinase [Streptomyces himalayensis]|uniref:Sugar kinase n=1 Tax=Streptomyces himalayensis subsp. himalayensis TaxID=2756131 RepID=A0A7W0DQ02_9ACTN|nr:sugar kinase [Streptomyces himalayensis]MBA2949096.1 sugar kinase [Streptomyces himalayensis subsp. himalayensis]
MTTDGLSPVPDVVDVVTLGESMVTFLPSRPGRLADVPSFDRAIGGAESNVACVLAAAGHSTRWVSRVGADGFGDHLVETIGGYGVDVTSVRRDPERPTGIYFRTAGDRATDAHEVAYYRAGSAASAMAADSVDLDALRAGRILHLSGITAALSEECLGLMRELTASRPGRPLVSFDVNHRPGLWREADGPRVLLELARGADIVFVGDDEAREAWGLHGVRAIREALPEPEIVVVKQGKGGATVLDKNVDGLNEDATGTATFVRALDIDVVAHVGAGDAFAAGFLSATLRGLPVRDRLRHGHLMAAAALTVPGDLGTPPARSHADRLAALDDNAWGTLRLGPGWTDAVTEDAHETEAKEEVRTP